MAAVELWRRGIRATLVEGSGRAGRGTAYSTREPAHLLNVPAAMMSAFADDPDDFACAVAGENYAPGDFVPRARFGDYVRGLLDSAIAAGGVTLVENGAVAAVRSLSLIHI